MQRSRADCYSNLCEEEKSYISPQNENSTICNQQVDLSISLAEERAWRLRCLDGYVGSGGSEWVGGETDSDDDYYFPRGGGDGDDCDAYDYL